MNPDEICVKHHETFFRLTADSKVFMAMASEGDTSLKICQKLELGRLLSCHVTRRYPIKRWFSRRVTGVMTPIQASEALY